MNTAPLSLSGIFFLFVITFCLLSVWNQYRVKIKTKWWTPNDQLSGVNWLFALLYHCVCKCVFVLVHGCVCVCVFLSMVMCVSVCKCVCVCVPHRECVLCDPGNADQRVNRRTNKRRPPFIHLLSLSLDLVHPIFIYWSMGRRRVVFAGRSWQPGDKAPQGTQGERESHSKYETEGEWDKCWSSGHGHTSSLWGWIPSQIREKIQF